MNHIIKSATLKLFHYESIDEHSKHLAKFLNYYNFEKKLKRLKFTPPYDKIIGKISGKTLFIFEESFILLYETKQLDIFQMNAIMKNLIFLIIKYQKRVQH